MKYSRFDTLLDRNKKKDIPIPKKGAHIGNKYHELIEVGIGISAMQIRHINESLRISGTFDTKKGKQIAVKR